VIIERKRRTIIDARQTKGSVHDFKLYKDTIGKNVDTSITAQTDLGYLGIDKLHVNVLIPIKESKNHKLAKRERAYNKKLARQRVVIEHVNAKIKTFKVMAYPYRNRYDPMTSFTVMSDDIGNTFQDLKTTFSLLNSGSTSQLSGFILPNSILVNHTSIGASINSFKPIW
jgi:hypothetical protein